MRNEKRKYPRVKVRCPVVLMTSQGSLYGEVRNLSRVGALIRTFNRSCLYTPPLNIAKYFDQAMAYSLCLPNLR